MATRRNFEKMLMWIRAKKDELIYTATMTISFVGVFLAMIYKSPLLAGGSILLAGFIFLFAIIWNS